MNVNVGHGFHRRLTPGCFGRPTIEGKTALGASSPAKPALHIPDPLSNTSAWTSSSAILEFVKNICEERE